MIMLECTVFCVVDNHPGAVCTYIERAVFRLVKCIDISCLFLQGDILESTRFSVQQIQSGTCSNPHVSVVLFCNGGDGIYSGIQTDRIQRQIEAFQIIESSGPDISFGVFNNVSDILVRTYVIRTEQVRGEIFYRECPFIYFVYSRSISSCPNNAG